VAKRRSIHAVPPNRPAPAVPNGPARSDGVRNLLLAALPADDRDRLVPTLDIVPLKLKAFLHKPGEPLEFVYFPGGGFCSIVTVLEDGAMVEVATVGREGMVGVTAALDDIPPAFASMVQGETDICYRMTAQAFRREMDGRGAFYEVLTRFSNAFVSAVMQFTACNAVHSVEQRLARWLLMAQDRMGAAEFPLTQEFVAMMLGATRPTVTIVAGTLQKAGLITYHRGRVAILDREKLESASCECYRAARTLFQAASGAIRPTELR
jgi:CRP-like cAMP-binding protein